jgi:hypothetical protein
MSQHDHQYGGLGLGTTGTSYNFHGCILALVAFLTITKRDQTPPDEVAKAAPHRARLDHLDLAPQEG